ncbi:hypothetical protein ACFWY9_13510 [Amycolatopsis sp. NPDC059027]|uniref:hypothetical protein n=1 Tax=unclassified Amycolatopsis TaxID=2618356 RepID=UPI0036703908
MLENSLSGNDDAIGEIVLPTPTTSARRNNALAGALPHASADTVHTIHSTPVCTVATTHPF